jgi:hypothetical protein
MTRELPAQTRLYGSDANVMKEMVLDALLGKKHLELASAQPLSPGVRKGLWNHTPRDGRRDARETVVVMLARDPV